MSDEKNDCGDPKCDINFHAWGIGVTIEELLGSKDGPYSQKPKPSLFQTRDSVSESIEQVLTTGKK